MPTYEEFTTPRSQGTPQSRGGHGGALDSTIERVKRHSRKISNSLTKGGLSGGYQHVGVEKGEGKYEMRALMDPSETRVVSSPILQGGKVSGESFSVGGSEFEEGEGWKVVKI